MDVGMSAKATVAVPGERDRVPLWERRKSRRSFIGKASSRLTSLPQGENPGAGQAGGLIRACNAAWCRNRVARLASGRLAATALANNAFHPNVHNPL
jgi:hypothetical protein